MSIRLALCVFITASATSAFAEADLDGDPEVLKSLAAHYQDTRTLNEIRQDNAMIRLAAKGDAEGLRKALAAGARINARYLDGTAFLSEGKSAYTALMLASSSGHLDVVNAILSLKPDLEIERRGMTALYMAVKAGKDDITVALAAAGAKGDAKALRLTFELIRAACKGFEMKEGEGYPPFPGVPRDMENAPELADVLKRGAAINGTDAQGHTALMFAANLGRVDHVKFLLEHGADSNLKSKNGATALTLASGASSAAKEGRRQVVEILEKMKKQ